MSLHLNSMDMLLSLILLVLVAGGMLKSAEGMVGDYHHLLV